MVNFEEKELSQLISDSVSGRNHQLGGITCRQKIINRRFALSVTAR